MGKKINQLTPRSDGDVANNTFLLPLADPGTGLAGKMTIAQAKAAFGPRALKYTTTGSEGTTLTISALAGMSILSIAREGSILYEVTTTPDPAEYVWDSVNITLGVAVGGAGERFLIQYKVA